MSKEMSNGAQLNGFMPQHNFSVCRSKPMIIKDPKSTLQLYSTLYKWIFFRTKFAIHPILRLFPTSHMKKYKLAPCGDMITQNSFSYDFSVEAYYYDALVEMFR